jgi:hypothetical protein
MYNAVPAGRGSALPPGMPPMPPGMPGMPPGMPGMPPGMPGMPPGMPMGFPPGGLGRGQPPRPPQ